MPQNNQKTKAAPKAKHSELGRVPPNALKLEHAVLGALMLDSEAYSIYTYFRASSSYEIMRVINWYQNLNSKSTAT